MAGTDDWVPPVVSRDYHLATSFGPDNDARAELHIGSAAISFQQHWLFVFESRRSYAQIRITEGTLNVRVRRLEKTNLLKLIPQTWLFPFFVRAIQNDVNEAGDTTVVVVRDGQGEITGGGSAYTVHLGKLALLPETDQLDADIQRSRYDDDDFDHWCGDRDRREDHSQSSRYVSSD